LNQEKAMRTGVVSVALAAFVLLGTAAARADEEKVPLDKLPKAVTEAVKAKFPGAELVSAGKETENGQLLYEVALKHKGHKMDVTFKADGTLVSVEKEITAQDLPKAVAKTLADKYPKATFTKVEEETKDGKVTYEVVLVTAEKKTFEVVLSPDGKIVKEESKDKKKD
jgi:uncharacterized membrane protein YkoI